MEIEDSSSRRSCWLGSTKQGILCQSDTQFNKHGPAKCVCTIGFPAAAWWTRKMLVQMWTWLISLEVEFPNDGFSATPIHGSMQLGQLIVVMPSGFSFRACMIEGNGMDGELVRMASCWLKNARMSTLETKECAGMHVFAAETSPTREY